MAAVSLIISVLSLIVSVSTAWFTLFRRGALAMTTPSIVFFGFDFAPQQTAKIFLRTLLYSTAHRGQVIEQMYVRLRHEGEARTFAFWGYGETEKLSPGSGLYVSQTGIVANHHFVLSAHQKPYVFKAGNYSIEVFARLVGRESPFPLARIEIVLPPEGLLALSRAEGILFEFDPDAGTYIGRSRDAQP